MRWRVRITNIVGDERLFGDVLDALSIRIIKEESALFLISETFETQSTAGEVHTLAANVQRILREVGNVDPNIQLDFSFDAIFEECTDGIRKAHLFVNVSEAASASITSDAVVVQMGPSLPLSEDEKNRLEAERREREYQQLRRNAILSVVSAYQSDRALQVQRLLKNELTPKVMGDIADLIQEDMGSKIKDLTSSKQLARFYRSINHPEVFGEQARHVVSNVEPPPNPMGLEEARQFIRDLAMRWLEHKTGLRNKA